MKRKPNPLLNASPVATHSPTHLYNWNGPTFWRRLVVLLQLVLHCLTLLWQAFTTGSVTKAMPIQFIDGKSCIKKRKGCKTALSSYYTCLSRGLLLMASGRTHTHIHQRSRTKQFQETRRVLAEGLRAPGLKKKLGLQ